MDQPITDDAIEIEARSFEEAIAAACARLGLSPREIAIDMVDPGSSESSSLGFRPVKVKVRRRDPQAAPDGAGRAPTRERRFDDSRREHRDHREPRGVSHRAEPRDFGPPPPPLDPSLITEEMVVMVGDLAGGLLKAMELPGAAAEASKSKHGIRVGVSAGEFDSLLIGPDGETLAALQHILTRMIRSRLPDSAPPRLEVDVAGFRDKQIEGLRTMARGLADEVLRGAPEATTDPLPASERRIVHLEVAETPGLETVTVGDGYYKRVIVRRATPKE
ncbi:MAG TPA: R3H domain-containing nucleic acid-binding protein [Candidatus Eisenbacteria bacterium]|nr:R3H domain-containing nucleic acid-binding protein [Candidatus Eisenbacteria bacterium]